MKISAVAAQTKLSKRTIYFYINEGLLQPTTNADNGYHDFTMEDVKKLQIISKLRNLDFSLADIRNILRFPGTASYYFYRQMEELSGRVEVLQHNVQMIASFFETEGAAIDQAALLSNLDRLGEYPPQRPTREEFTARDAKLIPLFIWAPYLTSPMDEYQEFIWEKISKKLVADYLPFLRNMKRTISSVRPQQLRDSEERMKQQVAEITALCQENMEDYAQRMLGDICSFLDDAVLVKKWNLVYPVLIYPMLSIGYSQLRNMMFLLNQDYKRFYDNVSVLCDRVWRMLTESPGGQQTYARINTLLAPIDWTQNGRGELERMSCFSFSAYALLSQSQLENILFRS